MKYITLLLFSFLSFSSLYSCTTGNGRESQPTVEQNEGTPIKIARLDSDLFEYIQNPTPEKQDALKAKYGSLLEAFGSTVFNNSDVEKPIFFSSLDSYFSNDMLLKIYKDEQARFNNVKPYEEELTRANALIFNSFEGKELPSLSIHVSGFKENAIATDSIISISADKYLGSDYPVYQNFFENYQLIQMQPEMITRDFLKAWLLNELPKVNDRKNLLSEMIKEGKILFALEELLPEWTENDLIGYSPEQLEWSQSNEKMIWNKTIQDQYLYSNDSQVLNKYINDAPYTALISPDSPGYLGRWIGWQIVRAYATKTGASLEDIFLEKDNQNILKLSKYNP